MTLHESLEYSKIAIRTDFTHHISMMVIKNSLGQIVYRIIEKDTIDRGDQVTNPSMLYSLSQYNDWEPNGESVWWEALRREWERLMHRYKRGETKPSKPSNSAEVS